MAAPNSIPLPSGLEAMDHEIQLLPDLAGQPPAEGVEEGTEVGEGIQPLVAVPGQRPIHASTVDVEAAEIEIVGGGNEAERGLDGPAAAVDAVDHPLEDARVLTVARPQEAALSVTPEPVHAEDLRRMDGSGAHGEPVREVAAHVVAAKRNHGHGIAAHHTHLSGDGRGGLG